MGLSVEVQPFASCRVRSGSNVCNTQPCTICSRCRMSEWFSLDERYCKVCVDEKNNVNDLPNCQRNSNYKSGYYPIHIWKINHRITLILKSSKSRSYAALVRSNRSSLQSTCNDVNKEYRQRLVRSQSMSHCASSFAKGSSDLVSPCASSSQPSKSHGLHRSIARSVQALRLKHRKNCSTRSLCDNNQYR